MNQLMNITKQLKKKAVLFLAFVLLLTATIATSVFAGDPDPTVTFTFNPEECKVILTYTGLDEDIPMESGVAVPVPYGKEVTVTVIPKLGYELKDIWNADEPGKSIKNPYAPTYYTSSFLASVRARVECVTSVFDVKFEKADVTKLPYKTESGDMAEFSGLKYYYKQAEQITQLPVVVRDGYTFQYWQVIKSDGTEVQKIVETDEEGFYFIPSTIINQDMVDNGTIYLHAEFTPDPQPVFRYDQAYDSEIGEAIKLLGTYDVWTAPMDQLVSALTQMGDDAASDDPENPYLNYKSYAGYRLVIDESAYPAPQPITKPTDVKPKPNVFYRYYEAIVYSLVYEGLADGILPEGAPTTYKFDTPTAILQPTRRGYTFKGWQVTIDGTVVDECTSTDFILGNLVQGNEKYAAKDERIVLSAVWEANTYNIVYDWGVTDETLKAHLDELNAALPKTFTFDSIDPIDSVSIADPTREGYTFLKWILRYTDGDGNPQTLDCLSTEGVYTLLCNAYAQDITLSTVWEAKKYTVALDGTGAAEGYTTKIENVVFDAPLTIPIEGFVIPTRLGFTFDGYWSAAEGGEKYINADGTSNCNAWDLYLDTDGVITLYARWIRNSYDIVIDVTGIPEGVTGLVVEIITADGTYVYGTDTIRLPFETEFTVKITSPDSYKVVTWNGKDVAHAALFLSDTITVGAENLTLSAQLRQKATVPTVNVDYVKEHFLLENGEYLIYLDPTAPIRVQINGNSITVNGFRERAVVIPDSFFGKAISVVYLGGTQYADSDPITVELAARPEPPKYHEQIHSIDNTYDTQIKVIMLEECAGLFEYAISLNPDFALLSDSDWKSSQTHTYTFENLQPGTTYYVFIRKAATETTPHGQVYTQSTATMIAKYFPNVIDRLNGMLNEDDGDLTKELIQNAIDTITEWKDGEDGLPATFYLDVEALLAAVEAKIAFTRLQDSKIAMLESFRDECLASGSLNDTNKTLLNSLCAQGVADITAATQSADVDQVYQSTMAAMEIVPFSYLYNVDRTLQLFSLLGLNQDSSLSARRFEDLDALRRMVDEAIRTSGRVVVDTFMSQEDAELLLRTLDVVDAYRFNLINAIVQTNDTFTVRMQIPEALLGMTGLQVAYYDEATGMLELLETTVEGDELVFKAKRIADFVILADPTIDLTAVIIALGVLMLCQIIAIAVVLVSRSKGKKLAQNACVALPAFFMTVHFAPVNAEKLALIMGGAVILLQIILMWLLLSSDMIRARKKKEDEEEESVTETAEPTTVAEMPPDAYSTAEQTGDEQAEDALEVEEASDELEEVYEDEEFIEPAANPYYSLPDEESAFAYDDEELAGEETVEYDPDATEENSFDDVFAEDGEEVYSEEAVYEDAPADAEDAYAYDENGYAYDESAYAYAEVDEEVVSDEDEAISLDEETEESVLYDDEEVIEEVTDEDGEEDDGFYRYDE